jgi:hypothetical protein
MKRSKMPEGITGEELEYLTNKRIGELIKRECYKFTDKTLIACVVRDTFKHAFTLGEINIISGRKEVLR